MQLHWKSARLKENLENQGFLARQLDPKAAKKVAQRLREIGEVPSYAQLPPATNKHPIGEGKRFLYYAVDVPGIGEERGKWRLVFKPYGSFDLAHVETITEVIILGIIDYHQREVIKV